MAKLTSIGLSLLPLAVVLSGVGGVLTLSDPMLEEPSVSKLCGHVPLGPLKRSNPVCQTNVSQREDFGLLPADWAPWTHQPYCANTSFCVFTNSAFQHDRGVSIISTPANVARSLHLLESTFARPLLPGARNQFSGDGNEEDEASATTPPYEVRDIPHKGKGLVATAPLKMGHKFMVDYASVIADVAFPSSMKQTDGQKLLQRAVVDLPRSEQVIQLARSRSGEERVIEDLIRTNSFGLKLNNVNVMVLFPMISRINHDCGPNSFIRFSENTLSMSAIALRDIEAGEEITISYSEFGLKSEERRAALFDRWGFRCNCALCTASAEEKAISDARRDELADMREAVLDHVRRREFREALSMQAAMLDLMREEESLNAPIGEHYQIRARLLVAVGDVEEAKKYATMALEDLEIYHGEDYEEEQTLMREILGLKA